MGKPSKWRRPEIPPRCPVTANRAWTLLRSSTANYVRSLQVTLDRLLDLSQRPALVLKCHVVGRHLVDGVMQLVLPW